MERKESETLLPHMEAFRNQRTGTNAQRAYRVTFMLLEQFLFKPYEVMDMHIEVGR